MREKARVGVVEGLRDAHRWLDELIADPQQSIETIAAREHKTGRSIRMTISLAFLAPTIVKAAIEGRMPQGFGVTRFADAPMAWSASMGRLRPCGSRYALSRSAHAETYDLFRHPFD